MKYSPRTEEAYQLLHDGTAAFADMEARGIRVDRPYCRKTIEDLKVRCHKLSKKIQSNQDVKKWKAWKGSQFNLDSDDQLGKFLFGHMGLKSKKETHKGKASVDKEALQDFHIEWLDQRMDLKRLAHAQKRLEEIMREQVDGLLHPFFDLHTVQTFRSSSGHINFQNQDKRDKEIAMIVRGALIPRKGKGFMESDFKGVEVCASACQHKDPVLIKYIKDPKTDMHRDQAMDCYELLMKQVSKEIRYSAKNGFVFPEFYGSYWKQVAPSLWDNVHLLKLTTSDGIPLMDHLKAKKLIPYSRFEQHIKEVERRFWYEKFKVYTQWKESFWNEYLRKGYFHTLTGFTCSGLMRKNQVLNHPIQGPAFHCMLWTLIQVNRILKKSKMGPFIVGQIHDSIAFDNVGRGQAEDLRSIVDEVATKKLPAEWPWIIVPLKVDYEISEPDQPWSMKEELAT